MPAAKRPALNGSLVTINECSRRHKLVLWVIGGLVLIAAGYMEAGRQIQAEVTKRIDGTLLRIEAEQGHQRNLLEDIRRNGGGG